MQVAAGDTAPPDLEEVARAADSGAAAMTITPIAFKPSAQAAGARQRRGVRPATLGGALAIAGAAVVAWFTFTAKSVELTIDPAPTRVSVPGTLFKLKIGEQEEPEKQNASAQATPKKPADPDQAVSSSIEQLGLTLQKISDQLREKYGLSDNAKGVVITKVAANSPAAEKQLQAGDVILEVDQKAVTTPQEVSEIVAKLQAQKKRSVLLFVERQGDPRFAALRLTAAK